MKKSIVIILAFLLIVSFVPVIGHASSSGSCGTNVKWHCSGGTLTISGTGDMSDYGSILVLPWEEEMFYTVDTIKIMDGVTSIGKNAFRSFVALEHVYMADSVKEIGDYAFIYTTRLKAMTIGRGVTTIGKNVFESSGLRALGIPASVKTIGANVLEDSNDILNINGGKIYYGGTYEQLLKINLHDDNDYFLSSAIVYDFDLVDNISFHPTTTIDRRTTLGKQLLSSDWRGNMVAITGDWRSSNPSVATVSSNGFIAPKSDGTTKISLYYQGYEASCIVTVITSPPPVTALFFNVSSVNLTEGQSSTIYAMDNNGETHSDVTWSSSDTSVATVSGGHIYGVYEGTATITATYNGITTTCSVTVSPKTENGFKYRGTTILGYTSASSQSLYIPETVGGNPVTVIADGAFYGMSNLTYVEIPGTVFHIGENAFGGTDIQYLNFGGTSYEWANIYFGSGNSSIKNAEDKQFTNSVDLSFNSLYAYNHNTIGCAVTFGYNAERLNGKVTLEKLDDNGKVVSTKTKDITLPKNISNYDTYEYFLSPLYADGGRYRVKYVFTDSNGIVLATAEETTDIPKYLYSFRNALLYVTGKHTAEAYFRAGFYDYEDKIQCIYDFIEYEDEYYYITALADKAYADENNYYPDTKAVVIPKTVNKIGKRVFANYGELQTIYYMGSKSEWNNIEISSPNNILNNASIVYNYIGRNVVYSSVSIKGFEDGKIMGCLFIDKVYEDCRATIEIRDYETDEVNKTYTIDIDSTTDYRYEFEFDLKGDDKEHKIVVNYDINGVPCGKEVTSSGFYAPMPTYEEGYYRYKAYDDYAKIVAYYGNEVEIHIPETLGGIPVGVIEYTVFQNDITEKVYVPKTVTDMPFSAFILLENLKEIVIDENNPDYCIINGSIFTKDLKTLIWNFCKTDTEYSIPSTTEIIGEGAFASSKLKKITFPQSVKYIHPWAFMKCEDVEEFVVAEDNENYAHIDGVLLSKDKTKIIQYPYGRKAHTYIIPNSITTVGKSSFEMAKVKTVYIPKSVTKFEEYPFSWDMYCVCYEGSEEEFLNIEGSDMVGAPEFIYNAEATSAELMTPVAHYYDGTLTIRGDIKYIFEKGMAIVAVYDEDNKMVYMEPITIDSDGIKCTFDADADSLNYKVKIMCFDSLNKLRPICIPVDTTVRKSVLQDVVLESEHPCMYAYDYYQYDGECESIDITFSSDTDIGTNGNINIISDNSYYFFTSNEAAGKTVNIRDNFFSINCNGDENSYGYKIEKIVVNL